VQILDFPLWLRAAHFFNFLLLSLLIRSGFEILSAKRRPYRRSVDTQRPR